ncbi:MAG: hypothetical protein B6D46_12895 [Polyangiaceae bacterium UTPRO1]|jgi:hypothetical protein|nr:MAG: hypothetical protein B6D46_12895 [Polyangiaceae bacterium UTPRO1]
MGVVYHVRDTTRGRENALKTLAPGRSEDIIERFLTEAQVMFRLEHDNIVRVYDFGKDGETYFLTMELIRGKNLRQLLNARQNKGFPLAEVIRMGIQAADALNYAHSQKPEAVVHRDIKPVNIMVEEETGRVVVADFGIAKLMADAGGGETQIGNAATHTVFAGTVPYSAPEQFLAGGGGRRLDARVDIYALGIVLYEIYTGRHFFAGLSAEEVEQHHRSIETGECPVKRPHACDHKITTLPEAPQAFIEVIERAIARDRHERYRTAAEMLADLRACAAVESVEAVAAARRTAEAAGALEAATTDFRRGDELEREAQAARERGDDTRAGELYRDALQAYGAAAAQANERRSQRAAQQAKTAMQIVAREATERDLTALAPEAMKHAAQLVATAEASEVQGQYEQATAQYRQAEEAFRAALVTARQASARKAIEDEMPALRAAREAAEQADAATLAADVFAAAVREQIRLEEALAAGELTRVRELLPQVRDRFAAAGEEAGRRLHQSVDEARAAMRAAAAEATAADAPRHAKAESIEAEALAGAAEKLIERGQLELAAAQLGRAADAYRAAASAAARAGEREVLEKELPALRAARAAAESAGAATLAADTFAAAAREQADFEAALAAGELTRVRTLLPRVGDGFAAARQAAILAQASRAALAARSAMAAARDAAIAAGAEQLVPDALARVRAREREAAAAEEDRQWDRAEQLYREVATAFDEVRAAALRRAEEERLAAALVEARSSMEAARTRARNAGAERYAAALVAEADALAQQAGGAANDAAGMASAAADYARARERYDAAITEAARVARRHELRETLATVAAAKQQAVDAGADETAEFIAAADELAAAERALAADELSLVVSSAAAARERFAAAENAAARAKIEAAADTALADAAAAGAEAREAGAETLAAAAWAVAVEQQQRALARRRDGDCNAVPGIAAEAERAFAAALEEAVHAAYESAVAARAAAGLDGPDDQAANAAEQAFTAGERRQREGKRVAAAIAFRKAAESYRAVTAARAGARAARDAARAAHLEAEAAGAAELAAAELAQANETLAVAERALESGDYDGSERSFATARDAFGRARDAAVRAAAERDAQAARARVEDLRATRAPAAAGFFARRKLAKADAAHARGTAAATRGNFAAAAAAYNEAAEVLAALPAGTIPPPAAPTAERAAPTAAAAETMSAVGVAPGSEATTLAPDQALADATVVSDGAAVAGSADATVVAAAAGAATVVARQQPPAPTGRGLPVAWIGIGAAGVALLAGVWLLRGGSTGTMPQPAPPQVAVPADAAASKEAGAVAPPAPPQQVVEDRRPEPAAPTAPPQQIAKVEEPPPPEVPAAAPVISGFEPRGKTVQAAPGRSTRFKVTAKDDGSAPLRYAWFVDDKAAGDGTPTLELTPTDDDEGTTREVRAEVAVGTGPVARTAWTVTVPRAPVAITHQVPAPAEIIAALGDATDFSVEARAGRAPASALSYVWTVDKRPVHGADGPRFTYRSEHAGSTDVEVRVEAPERAAAVRHWTVRAHPREPVAVPTQVAALPPRLAPTPLAPHAGSDPRRELESWIASYRDAYQRKNVDELLALGVVKPENRSKLAAALNDLVDLEVRIARSAIDVHSPDSAVVTLTREDSFNAGGRRQTQSIDIRKNLHKVNGSWVAQ